MSGFEEPKTTGGSRGGLSRKPAARTKVISISTAGEIVVTGLDGSVTSDDIRDIMFEKVGIVTKAYVLFDKLGKPKGEAHVEFAKRADALYAVELLDKALVDKKQIRVRMADAEEEATYISRTSPSPSPRRNRGRGFDNEQDYRDESDTSPFASRRTDQNYGANARQTSQRNIRSSGFRDMPASFSNPLDRSNALSMNSPIGRGRGRGRNAGRRGRRARGRVLRGGGTWERGGGVDKTTEDLDMELDAYLN